MIILMFACALALSGAAAFYSIAGLMAIFAASPMSIAVMGSTLEVTKLVVASWLYRNWANVPLLMKGYLTFALVVLMFLTSMGIFGHLSKAHLDQGVPTSDIAAKIALIDEKINIEKENIDAAKRALVQLDDQVNQTLSRTAAQSNDAGVRRSVAIRQAQSKERAQLTGAIGKSQEAITALNEEKAPIAAKLRQVEAEVGPVKYIAQLIYGQEVGTDSVLLEKAVQWVTILIVAVFDPLAVILLIAANWSIKHKEVRVPPAPTAPSPSIAPEEPSVTKIEHHSVVPDEPEPTQPKVDEFNWRNLSYLQAPFVHFRNTKPIVASRDPEPALVVAPPTENTLNDEMHDTSDVNVPGVTYDNEHQAFKPDESFWRSRPPKDR
jgi:hypothetical protein